MLFGKEDLDSESESFGQLYKTIVNTGHNKPTCSVVIFMKKKCNQKQQISPLIPLGKLAGNLPNSNQLSFPL